MQDDDSSEDKQIRSLQEMWQQSITNDAVTFNEREVMANIQREIRLLSHHLPPRSWSVIAFFIFLLARAIALAVKGFEIGDASKILWGYTGIIFWSIFAARHILVRAITYKFDMSSYSDFLTGWLVRVKQEIFYQITISPYLIAMLIFSTVISLWFDARLWLVASYVLLLSIVIVLEIKARDFAKNELEPLRNKLESALQQLNESQSDHTP